MQATSTGQYKNVIYVRVTADDFAKIAQAAKADGRKVADWGRRALIAEANLDPVNHGAITNARPLIAAAKKRIKAKKRAAKKGRAR